MKELRSIFEKKRNEHRQDDQWEVLIETLNIKQNRTEKETLRI
jgi:hypothetical protein